MALPIPKYNEIIELVKKGATLEAQEKIMALREAALELQEDNIELKKKIKALEEAMEVKNKIRYEKPYYWMIDGDKREGPFCQQCFDKEKLLIRLQEAETGMWNCKTCNNFYEDSRYNPHIPESYDNPYD